MKNSHLIAALCGISLIGFGAAELVRLNEVARASVTEAAKSRLAASQLVAKYEQKAKEDKSVTRTLVLRLAGLSTEETDPNVINDAIRDYVYRTNTVGIGGRGLTNDGERFAMLGEEAGNQLCGGMALSLAWALNQVGVPARIVQLAGKGFLDGTSQKDTHITVEASIGGAWRISDPTYNVHFNCSDGSENLSIEQAEQCVARGAQLVGVPGKTQFKGIGRTIADNYPAPYATFLAARAPLPREAAVKPIDVSPHPDWIAKALAQYK